MKKKKSPTGLIITLLIVAAIVLLVRHFHIKNFNVIKPEVLYTSGQPRGMDYTRLLYKYHIATIVNIRSASEHRERNWYNEEIIWVKSNGVNYIELPIRRDNYFPDKQTQDRFLAIMADRNKLPVLLHGSGGRKRVAMLTAVWLKKSQRCTTEEVFETVERINDDRKLTEAEKRFINSLAN
ncbi:MAG: fused DSP-PTPase phosphatase/NAD kinase-like protein [Planctomycetota bacterium]|jgi:protein tyrosine/serine phosphatase